MKFKKGDVVRGIDNDRMLAIVDDIIAGGVQVRYPSLRDLRYIHNTAWVLASDLKSWEAVWLYENGIHVEWYSPSRGWIKKLPSDGVFPTYARYRVVDTVEAEREEIDDAICQLNEDIYKATKRKMELLEKRNETYIRS